VKTLPKILVTLLAVGALAACDSATVEKVVDGDTVDVKVDGETVRVRLLNVDTPETVDPDEPVQCLGPEATEFLENLLPVGTKVGLEYDDERTDGYGRTLAGVYLEDKTLVNAEIARQGLGEPIVVGDNDRFYPEVLAASEEAQAAGRGLFDPDVDCTLAARVADFEERAGAALDDRPAADAGLDELDQHAAAVAAVLASAVAVHEALGDDHSVSHAWGDRGLRALGSRVDRAEKSLEADAARTEGLQKAEKQRRAEERREARERRAAKERAAKEKAAKERADAEAAAAARAEEARRASTSTSSSDSSGGSSSGGSSSGSGSSGSGAASGSSGGAYDPSYTGCRAYGPSGRWVDDKGRTYNKIDCTTKAIIG